MCVWKGDMGEGGGPPFIFYYRAFISISSLHNEKVHRGNNIPYVFTWILFVFFEVDTLLPLETCEVIDNVSSNDVCNGSRRG